MTETERGRLSNTRFIVNPKFNSIAWMKSEVFANWGWVNYTLTNVGRTLVTVRQSGVVLQLVTKAELDKFTPIPRDMPHVDSDFLVQPGEHAGSGAEFPADGGRRIFAHGPLDVPAQQRAEIKAETLFLLLRGYVRYDTIFGRNMRLEFAARWHPDDLIIRSASVPQYNREVDEKDPGEAWDAT